jgi:hypothetical protein
MSYHINKYKFKPSKTDPLTITKQALDDFEKAFGSDFPEINPFEDLLSCDVPKDYVLEVTSFPWGGIGSGDLELVVNFLEFCEGECYIEFVGEDGDPCGSIELRNGKVTRER